LGNYRKKKEKGIKRVTGGKKKTESKDAHHRRSGRRNGRRHKTGLKPIKRIWEKIHIGKRISNTRGSQAERLGGESQQRERHNFRKNIIRIGSQRNRGSKMRNIIMTSHRERGGGD